MYLHCQTDTLSPVPHRHDIGWLAVIYWTEKKYLESTRKKRTIEKIPLWQITLAWILTNFYCDIFLFLFVLIRWFAVSLICCNHVDSNEFSAKDKKDAGGNNKDANKKESKYADVPNVMFYCHMCKKHMWDATSFENHVKGRTHLMMREGVEESYRLKANMIRQEAKIEEQLKSIELERLKRMGKAGKGNFRREYCTMCDLNFYGHLTAHRKTDGHLNLKKFLHPKCLDCSLEFPNRIDFDGHILSPEHMKRAFITKSNKPEKRKNQLTIYTEEDELKDLKEEKDEKKKEKKTTDADESMETDETTTTATAEKPEVCRQYFMLIIFFFGLVLKEQIQIDDCIRFNNLFFFCHVRLCLCRAK